MNNENKWKLPLMVGFGALAVSVAAIFLYKRAKQARLDALKVIHVDTRELDEANVREGTLYDLYELAKQSYARILDKGKANEQQAATLYSLHKQFQEGNADEFAKHKENSTEEKYAVWLQ